MPILETISTKLRRIAKLAREAPERAFVSLGHNLDMDWMKEAYRRTRKDGAVGVDGQTARQYEQKLEENLQELLDRAKAGTYRAPPVRRVHIPKGDGKQQRPIGIPTLEDKVLQRAVSMVLETVYEQDFLPCSYGFRPQRSAHQALQVLRDQLMAMGGGTVIEVDIEKFFDSLDHARLREILSQRVRDGVLVRLIGKWLNAGVMDKGELHYPEAGTPQGGVISPLLANVYLHEVLDVWFEQVVKPRLRGQAHMIRYADDVTMAFACEEDAHRVMKVLAKRLEKYGLKLNPDKTRMVNFRPPPRNNNDPGDRPGKEPSSFDVLGFRHYWGRSLRGYWVIKRKTASDRFTRALKRIAQWCKVARHWPIAEQHQQLCQKLRGHYGYYGITGNCVALGRFKYEVRRVWRKWLGTRSWRAKSNWDWFAQLEQRFPLPPAVAVHSSLRRAAKL
jgi:group II intron reverse transcriptase/maturase